MSLVKLDVGAASQLRPKPKVARGLLFYPNPEDHPTGIPDGDLEIIIATQPQKICDGKLYSFMIGKLLG
jgi:hypothetical protein